MMSTERKKKPSKADYRRKKKLGVFDHTIHQKLATDVIEMPFDAQWYDVFGYGTWKFRGVRNSRVTGIGLELNVKLRNYCRCR